MSAMALGLASSSSSVSLGVEALGITPTSKKSVITQGPGCSKLTTSLVYVLLKFQPLISQICQYFLLKNLSAKAFKVFSTKNFSVFRYLVIKHLTS